MFCSKEIYSALGLYIQAFRDSNLLVLHICMLLRRLDLNMFSKACFSKNVMVRARSQYSYIVLPFTFFLSLLNLGLTDDRNNIEKLTLAVLSYLPIAVLYVHDLSEDCGTKVADQVHLIFTSPDLLMSLIYANFPRSNGWRSPIKQSVGPSQQFCILLLQ
jgi:hypothetical protein